MGINEMIQEQKDSHESFKQELTELINKYSMENLWDMPDFLMCESIYQFLIGQGNSIKKTLDWYRVDSVCHPSPASFNIDVDESGFPK